ncbi:exodeoxyribonuclease VII large subunit [Peribacillus frigoritolerans]|jgi:exodeoxyribonuclease VII large subunit|uniref:Exodeoxyribonuclease 7 large subunit n=1 Tax=Peribacillus frigoritolerans TaxID=450367 RepID=A0AAJ1QPZ6_9BACI|nr:MULTISPECIES: exodeoxyribonuclease VII large subunit [Bacillaceae]KRF49667.1 exodeoxyribonuclease VII large subunit [Bacillus sp. Soil745]MBD8135130.1 exodeoxyribonuclease VII large subunit [Bacillus sp. CFBP 13597]PAW30267.1 exodeoxyribonuclease VII large subunit [Peribacillus simplex]PEF35292.1 exodeoxyribonuclease VII large subunit [Bacillus sp. AFS094228]PEO45210.1 exodeoxyribonuclease VII large subunit [Bacillus sp. AFS026049]QYF85133.1 exodeoxyribonuclease VII large subunit [Brevibac
MSNQQYLSVSALTKYIKRKFDADPHLQNVYIKGEISNFKQHTSGHMYFTLKDEKARLLSVMFAANNKGMKFLPENGMKVLVKGDISLYEAGGQYQLYVKSMAPDGVGDLYLAYEQLKKKLEGAGLFLAEHKKPIPQYPKSVGVITSPTGAALRDILTTIKRRYPIARIIVYPALVQGNNAAKSIAKAISMANARAESDVLIVGRGGGSIEELWAFNEEIVAESIYDSDIPVISAVGHETDFTIADFVADMRAPTPTGAAELAVPHLNEILERLMNRKNRLTRSIQEAVNFERTRLTRMERSYAFRYPHKMYEQKLEQLDKTMDRLGRTSTRYFMKKRDELNQLNDILKKQHPEQAVKNAKDELQQHAKVLRRAMEAIYRHKSQQFVHITATLSALSPLKIMERGYGLVFAEDETLVKSTQQVSKGDKIAVSIKDGTLECEIKEIKERIES